MCGIAGVVDPGTGEDALRAMATGMAAALTHRGPDDAGSWVDAGAGLALGHRRLSIIDLSASGHQPMVSADGRWVITYNGELYNAPGLRRELKSAGTTFRGESDTEVFLEAIARWGVRPALVRANAMFALAAWDRHARALYLARDRMGEKPLYYGRRGRRLVFASELKAITALGGASLEIDHSAVLAYLRHSYVPCPRSIYQGIAKLAPAQVLRIDLTGGVPGVLAAPEAYWSLAEVAAAGLADPADLDDAGAADALEAALAKAVSERMASDVALGATLSGGIDSSTVVALMARAGSGTPRTFSIGFGEDLYNEAPAAKAVAAHLGTEHTELYVTPKECLALVPDVAAVYDEPFADSSQVPTMAVCALARRHVTVALSGDGGDELFWGYDRYGFMASYGDRLARLPPRLRRGAVRPLRAMSTERLQGLADALGPLAPRALRNPHAGHRLQRMADLLATSGPHDLYRQLMSQIRQPETFLAGVNESSSALSDTSWMPGGLGADSFGPLADQANYLPDDILTKVDRASMAASLELRAPFLDPDVVALAWRLAPTMKRRGGQGKWLLRQVLYRHVPPALVDRPKQGFGVPIGEWLRGPLRDWASDLLASEAVARHGLLDPAAVSRAWADHQSGRSELPYAIWNLCVLQGWLEGASAGSSQPLRHR